VLAAVRRCGCSLAFAPPPSAFSEDEYREIVLEAVRCDGDALESAPETLRDDDEIVQAAVGSVRNPLNFSLQWASARLKDDKAVVLSACTAHGHALQFASERLRSDHDCAVAACFQDSSSIRHVGAEALASKNTMLKIITQSSLQGFRLADVSLKRDPEVCVAAVSLDPNSLDFDHPPFRPDFFFSFDLVGFCLEYAGKDGVEALHQYVDETLEVHAKLRLLVYPRVGGRNPGSSGWPGSRVRSLIADFTGGPGEEHHRHLRRVHAKLHRREVPPLIPAIKPAKAKAAQPGASGRRAAARREEKFIVL